MRPFRIFFDTEFSGLGVINPKLVSIGCITQSGQDTFYAEVPYTPGLVDSCHPFVRKHILPHLERGEAALTELPMCTLTLWRIFRAGAASNHFVGINTENGLMRVSTDIIEFDVRTMAGVTQSGRFYKLEGPAGKDEKALRAEMAFSRWAWSFGLHSIQDVTDTVLTNPTYQRGFTH